MKQTPVIFLSYTRSDKANVEEIYKKLSEQGFKPWMDTKNLKVGEQWEIATKKTIRSCDYFLACLSKNSVMKRGMFQKELRMALDILQEKFEDDIFLIPVFLDECKVPEILRQFHWVKLFEEDGWQRLLEAIQVSDEDSGTMINPYKSRGPIKQPQSFYGREFEVLTIYDSIKSGGLKGASECVSIVGERRIGKSSLLHYIYNKDNRSKYLNDYNKYIFSFIDCTLLDINRKDITPEVFFHSILKSLSKELEIQLLTSGDFENFKHTIAEVAKDYKIVVLLDEFDSITKNSNFGYGFFSALRGLVQEPDNRLGIITASLRNLWELVHNVDLAASPFFNIFNTIFLKAFDMEDALSLVTKPFGREAMDLTDEEIKFVLDLAGTHPLFLQIACSYMFDFKRQNKKLSTSDFNRITALFEQESQPHFESILSNLSLEEKSALKATLTGRIKKGQQDLLKNLENKGYLIEEKIFSSVFKKIFEKRKFPKEKKKIISRNISSIVVLILCSVAIFIGYFTNANLKYELIAIGLLVSVSVIVINNFEYIFRFTSHMEN